MNFIYLRGTPNVSLMYNTVLLDIPFSSINYIVADFQIVSIEILNFFWFK